MVANINTNSKKNKSSSKKNSNKTKKNATKNLNSTIINEKKKINTIKEETNEERITPNSEIEDFIDEVLGDRNLYNELNIVSDDTSDDDFDDIYQETELEKTDIINIDGIDYEVEYKKVKIRRLRKLNLILLIILLSLIIIFCLMTLKTTLWLKDNHVSESQIQNIIEVVEVMEVDENDNVEIIENKEVEQSDPYWDYIKMNLIDVDFNELKKENNDTKGWIQVNGTNINYPFVQTTDNDFYLNHSFDKSYNDAGWVFLDYRNDLSKEEKNTIIYGHSRIDKTMFGSLKNILNNNWLNNSDNYIIKLSTEYENTLWQIFSIYHIPTTTDYLKTVFNNTDQFNEFTNMILNRSLHNFNTSVSSTDRILTLSTCFSNNEKIVLHAKLIKKEQKK